MVKRTAKATMANKQAAIDHAMLVFKFLEENDDLVKADPSNKGIARTLKNYKVKTRSGSCCWDATAVRRLQQYRSYYEDDDEESSSECKG